MMNCCCAKVYLPLVFLKSIDRASDLKGEFLLLHCLSNDGESQGRCLLREVVFGGYKFHNLKEPLLPGRPELIHVGCIGEH